MRSAMTRPDVSIPEPAGNVTIIVIGASDRIGTFLELHKARRQIEVSCQMLHNHVDDLPLVPDPQEQLWEQMRADLCGLEGELAPEGDRIGKRLTAFKEGVERVCRPMVEHRVGKKKIRKNR